MTPFAEAVAKFAGRVHSTTTGKFGAKIVEFPEGTKAIVKFGSISDKEVRGIPKARMHLNEVAAFALDDKLLHFNIVPEVLKVHQNGRPASLQQFKIGYAPRELVPGLFDLEKPNWKERLSRLLKYMPREELIKLVVFDLITNNTDRHGRNIIVDTANKKVWAIDNALAFGRCYKNYRSVFHKFYFFRHFVLPASIEATLKKITLQQLQRTLGAYLPFSVVKQTYQRIQFILQHKDRLAFANMSKGHFDKNEFPSYAEWFRKQDNPPMDESVAHVLDLSRIPGWTEGGPKVDPSQVTR